MKSCYTILLLTACLLTVGCSTALTEHPPKASPPTIILSNSGLSVNQETVIAALHDSNYIILGETHDNPAHHTLQAEIIESFIANGLRPTIILEMLDTNEQKKIQDFFDSEYQTAADFNEITGFSKKGWDYEIYLPLLNTLAKKQLPIIGGNLPRHYSKPIIKEGLDSIPTTIQNTLNAFTYSKQQTENLYEEIVISHCNALPEAIIPGMINIQLARDASLATAMLQSDKPVILITGSGHARKSTAVPAYLAAIDSSATTTSLSFIENDSAHINNALKEYDYGWLTRPAQREDPCLAFKKSHIPRNNSSD